MATYSMKDVALIIRSANTTSERRVTPSWTLSEFKAKLERITGVPPSFQQLTLRTPGREPVSLAAQDEFSTQMYHWDLQPYSEVEVKDTGGSDISRADLWDTSAVPKYSMASETYEQLPSSVLAWKKANKLGRFDPDATDAKNQTIDKMWREVEDKKLQVSMRCQVGQEFRRRGEIAYIGQIPEIPGIKGPWIGVILDEPTGKNDGSLGDKRYFTCSASRGLFVRPDRVEKVDIILAEDTTDLDELEEI